MIIITPKQEEPKLQMEPLAVSTRDAAKLLGVSENTIAKLVKEGKITRRKIGWKSLYPVASLRAFLEMPNTDNCENS